MMLKIENITKSFPGVRALNDVTIEFNRGEIHALLGENGAGKSTLIKIITGVYKADHGNVYINEKKTKLDNPIEAFDKGINVVHQDLQIVPQASIAENIMLDKLPTKGTMGFLDWNYMNQYARKYLDMVGLEISPSIIVDRLSIGQKQLVLIAKALATENMKVLLLDEPTASITSVEVDRLFSIVNKLKQQGIPIIFVSHVLEEVLEIADKISVLRDGELIITDNVENLNRKKIVKYMIGREENTKPFGRLSVDKDKKVLEVSNLIREEKVDDVSFQLHKGEILGLYGLVGAGRTELAKIIMGEDDYDSGEIRINGEKVEISSVSEALSKYNMGYVTEDRRKEGLIENDEVKTNITITIWDRILNKLGFVSGQKEKNIAWEQVENLSIKTTGIEEEVKYLSGGNQQKVSISKWLAAENDIIIFDEPTVGVDIGAKEFIHKLIWDLAFKKDKAIILISSDMPEIVKLANRILVMSKKKIVGEIDNSKHNYSEVSSQVGDVISEYKVASTVKE